MRRRVGMPAILLAAHAAAAVWIAVSYRRSDSALLLAPVSALPVAQASLLAVWGVCRRGPSYLRFAVVVLGVTTLWAVECRSLNLPLADERSAAHALAFAVQTVLVSTLLIAIRLADRLMGRPHPRWENPGRRMQFGVGFLLGWVGAVAMILGAGRLVMNHAEWSTEVIDSTFFLFGAVVGVYSALVALIALGGASWGLRWHRLVAQGFVAVVLVCAVAASESTVLQALFRTDGNVGAAMWMCVAALQGIYLLITLIPIRICRYDQLKESSYETSTRFATGQAGLPDTA